MKFSCKNGEFPDFIEKTSHNICIFLNLRLYVGAGSNVNGPGPSAVLGTISLAAEGLCSLKPQLMWSHSHLGRLLYFKKKPSWKKAFKENVAFLCSE